MTICVIKTSSSRDYYTVGVLDCYWESIIKHLGDTVELISSESQGKRFKRLVYTVEVKNTDKFEEAIRKSTFDNWTFVRNYDAKEIKKRITQNKIKRLKEELQEAEENLKLF